MFPTHQARIFHFMEERAAILREVEDRVVDERLERARKDPERQGLEYALNEAAYLEMTRIQGGASSLDLFPYEHWHKLGRSVGRMDEAARAQALRELVRAYAGDVCGKFTPGVYKFASRVLPPALGVLFNAHRPTTVLRDLGKLSERVIVEGAVDHVVKLSKRGTIVVVPTHSSNLDSIAVGYALEAAGIPPLTYGAGKNLFTNPLTSFFMHNLGAYKVDRRIRHGIYKDVLKTYSEVLLERGYHSLFFPGGARSRSNKVESKLKLGLLGTGLTAHVHGLQRGSPKPAVYICPLTINYHLVLEAETLAADHLRDDGRARFIIEDDEFSQMGTVAAFVQKMLAMEYTLYLRFGEPLDVVGNRVDGEGRSLDAKGRVIDLGRFFWQNGAVAEEPQRDAEYTRELGEAIGHSFRRNTVAVSTAVVAFAAFDLLVGRWPKHDLFRLLRVAKGERITREELHARVDRLRERLRAMEKHGEAHLAHQVARLDAAGLCDEAARIFASYHAPAVLESEPDGFAIGHPNLLYWYANRLDGRGLHEHEGHARPSR